MKKDNGELYLSLWDHPDVISDPDKRNEILISGIDSGEVIKEIYGMKYRITLDTKTKQISVEHIDGDVLLGIASVYVYTDSDRKKENLPTQGYFAAMPFASKQRSQDHPTKFKVTRMDG